MRKAIFCVLCVAVLSFTGLSAAGATGTKAITPQAALDRITWHGQGALRIELGGLVIWTDPTDAPKGDKADIILVTHNHDDHFSSDAIKALSKETTVVLAGFDDPNYTRVKPGDLKNYSGIAIETVAAYNIIKNEYHPKSELYCGFVISGEGVKIYVAGDTERIPEMKKISCDIAFLPLGQTYTMNSVEEAVQSALDVKAKIAIPYHFGMYEGTREDAEAFVAALKKKGVDARILELLDY